MRELKIQRVPISQAHDPTVVKEITRLVNGVFEVAEKGMWLEGTPRTTEIELQKLIDSDEIIAAYLENKLVGVVRMQILNEEETEFGMLAVDIDHRGTGVGRELVKWVEEDSRNRGSKTVQLEILIPDQWIHPTKAFSEAWYTRMGYVKVRLGRIEDSYPELAPLLATTCDYVIYKKRL